MSAVKKTEDKNQKYIYRRYITKNGVRIYPKNGKVFKIPVNDQFNKVKMLDGSFSPFLRKQVNYNEQGSICCETWK